MAETKQATEAIIEQVEFAKKVSAAQLLDSVVKAHAEGYAAGRSEILAMVRKLPSPVFITLHCKGRCEWCQTTWAFLAATSIHQVAEAHPSNGCLFVLAQESGKDKT